MNPPARTLVISDGDVASVVACVVAMESTLALVGAAGASVASAPRRGVRGAGAPNVRGTQAVGLEERTAATESGALPVELRPIVWIPRYSGVTGAARAHAAERQCAVLRLPMLRAEMEISGDEPWADGEGASRGLLAACYEASRHRCAQVVWPVRCALADERGLDELVRAGDRAMLASRLVSLDLDPARAPLVSVDAPYADLTDVQLADLVVDLDAPIDLCWWWHAQLARGGVECSASFRAQQQRWTNLLKSLGWTRAAR